MEQREYGNRMPWLMLLLVWLTNLNTTLSRLENNVSPFLVQASGVTVSDICKTTYEEIKKDKKHRYVVFYIRDEKQIDVEVVGERNAEYDQFLEDLQKGGTGECR